MRTRTTPSQLEALAHEQINRRVAARHHASHGAPRPVRRQERLALLLRRLAERLDPPDRTQ